MTRVDGPPAVYRPVGAAAFAVPPPEEIPAADAERLHVLGEIAEKPGRGAMRRTRPCGCGGSSPKP